MGKEKGKVKSFAIHSRDLGREISKAERSEGYLIMITRKADGILRHIYFTQRFQRENIPKALEEHKKLLEREMLHMSTGSKEMPKVEKQKELPPEYRNK